MKESKVNFNKQACPQQWMMPYYNWGGKLQDMKRMKSKEWLFEANYEGTTVVVKFVRSYGKDVHWLLAANQLAPNCMMLPHYVVGGKLLSWKRWVELQHLN